MTETERMRAILVAVSSLPEALFWRANTGVAVTAAKKVVRFNVPGTPDIVGCHKGRFVGIEVKTPSGKLSDTQKNFQRAVERSGGVYLVARTVDDALAGLGVAV